LTKLGRSAIADTVVGVDSGLRAVMERVELVARSDVPVLILGETGTGKELIARLIHTRSTRSNAPSFASTAVRSRRNWSDSRFSATSGGLLPGLWRRTRVF